MSLLIDALKKHRLTSVPSSAQVGGDALKSLSLNRTKKIILISLVGFIVITLTATVSFLIFKHIEKKRIVQTLHGKIEQVQEIREKLTEKSSEAAATPSATNEAEEVREKLEQRVQQSNENRTNENQASVAAPVTSEVEAVSANDNSSDREALSARLAARRTVNNVAEPAEDNNDQNSNAVSSDTSSDDDSQDGVKEVDIQMIPNSLGANNPIYQKALGFMQANQYDKALSLLVDNDDLLLKTQGLSSLLLARIYLTTSQYELADQVLDHALMLHVGAEIDLLALRAQALFMQTKYQETINLLSTQSPDLSTSPEYYALLADAYMHLHQANNAVSIFQQIVARFPNSPKYWLGLAVAYQKTGDASSAIVAYRRAAQLSTDNPQVTLFINQQLQVLQAT